jgi:hypothetical protein
MPVQMLHLLETQSGGKLLHLPLSMRPSIVHLAQRQWLRQVEKLVIKL